LSSICRPVGFERFSGTLNVPQPAFERAVIPWVESRQSVSTIDGPA
jgi:hypothetical protein